MTGIAFDLEMLPTLNPYYTKIESGATNVTEDHAFDNLHYSKANFQLPVTTFKVESARPCLNPDLISGDKF